MNEIASRGQLRMAFLRWAVVTVPFILLLGLASAQFAPSGSDNLWFRSLALPPLMPGDWVFPVVWSGLYVLIGLALAIIINARGSKLRGPALVFFALQMIANLAWSPVFFGLHRVVSALVILCVLLVLALITTFLFARIRGVAAMLMVPYLLWIGFAGFLVFQINALNPDAESLAPSRSADQIQIR